MTLISFFSIGVALIAIAGLMSTRRQSRQLLERLATNLDTALKGELIETQYDEHYASAIEEKMNRFLTTAQHQAHQASITKEQVQSLVSNIAHQTKTPLTNVLLYCQLLSEKPLTTEEMALAKQIEQQSTKLAFFLDSLVKTSYLESQLVQVEKKVNDIKTLIDHSIDSVTQQAAAKTITIDYLGDGGTAVFDEKWTSEALVNVLDNAIKYSPANSHINLTVVYYEFFCCITVADQGFGIPENEHAQIFERFYRSSAVRHLDGLGIGLYLTRAILTEQGGYITVSSNADQGAIFSLYLPLA